MSHRISTLVVALCAWSAVAFMGGNQWGGGGAPGGQMPPMKHPGGGGGMPPLKPGGAAGGGGGMPPMMPGGGGGMPPMMPGGGGRPGGRPMMPGSMPGMAGGQMPPNMKGMMPPSGIPSPGTPMMPTGFSMPASGHGGGGAPGGGCSSGKCGSPGGGGCGQNRPPQMSAPQMPGFGGGSPPLDKIERLKSGEPPKSLEEAQQLIDDIDKTSANPRDVRNRKAPVLLDDGRRHGHMSQYARVIKATFPTKREARSVKAAVESGKFTLQAYAAEVLEPKRDGSYAHEHGDVGLIAPYMITNNDILVNAIFDIRNPLAANASDLSGPWCHADGCTLLAVLARYRRGFFSNEWRDAEQFCTNFGMPFVGVLRQLHAMDPLTLAPLIWPDDHATFQRIKWRQLVADYQSAEALAVDPSTILHSPSADPANETELAARAAARQRFATELERRKALFALLSREASHVLADHPEIYAMSFQQMLDGGLVTEAQLQQLDDHEPTVVAQRLNAADACGSGGDACSAG